MKFKIKWGWLLIPAFALAMPAFAPTPASATQTRDPRLSDSQEPGSILVFPKFIGGRSAAGGPVQVDGASLPRTEIEIGAVCPVGVVPGVGTAGALCNEHAQVKLKAHWVCPGSQDFNAKGVCQETSFELFLSVNGKIAFPADGGSYFSNQPRVQAPQCRNGYLIVWAVNNAGQAIKFDGLIGDAVIRGPENRVGPTSTSPSAVAGFSSAVSAYAAIPIQAHPALATGATTDTLPTGAFPTGTTLVLDGTVGHYQAVTGTLFGDVKFDNEAPAHTGLPTPANAFSQTVLVFLTLDVNSNASNQPTFVPITFYNESAVPPSTTNNNFENPTDGFVHFICWGQFQLSAIDNNLTQAAQNTRKGIFIAGPANSSTSPFVDDSTGPVTLLGLVHTIEGTAANLYQERSYIFTPYNDSVFVPTRYRFIVTTPDTAG
jgi:hypothetical protein